MDQSAKIKELEDKLKITEIETQKLVKHVENLDLINQSILDYQNKQEAATGVAPELSTSTAPLASQTVSEPTDTDRID